ncbi:tripartite tricarboxylate transporter substrate-binding protein [Piscinibacter sp. XHJ-5]|uniref:tripartite tricarboxylate transporter substrate-binding protein n=1 Tax=Piscinibacter sp. XHJ-5 TaxID=3037797 RepID=UPI002453333F|nr:tripartite tricarboxylate transporter substrate-binding protein [Piscinibacter sp. XHJ-5]
MVPNGFSGRGEVRCPVPSRRCPSAAPTTARSVRWRRRCRHNSSSPSSSRKPGAGNIIGTQAGATAAPDGYTLTMTGMLNTIAQGIYERVPFDIVADFAHVACIAGGEQWLVVNSQAGIASFAGLIEQARREPGKLNYATSGQGSTGHLVMELLQRATGTQLTHVPYKGGAPALQDVLAGLVPITVIPGSGAMQHVQSGKLKVLAVSSAARSPELPQVPTFEEIGHKQLTVISWVGLSAPKGTPPEIVDKVYAAVRASMASKDLMAKLAAEGLTAMLMSPSQYTQLVRSDTERWGQLTRSLNLKAN